MAAPYGAAISLTFFLSRPVQKSPKFRLKNPHPLTE